MDSGNELIVCPNVVYLIPYLCKRASACRSELSRSDSQVKQRTEVLVSVGEQLFCMVQRLLYVWYIFWWKGLEYFVMIDPKVRIVLEDLLLNIFPVVLLILFIRRIILARSVVVESTAVLVPGGSKCSKKTFSENG